MNGLGLVRRRRTSSIESPKKESKKPFDKKCGSSSDKSSKIWKSEIVTNNLKIRIRSPEADGLDKAIKQEDDGGPPMLTPETTPHGLDVNGVPNGTNNGLCSMGGQAAGHLQLPGAGRVEDAPDGGRDDDQDSAFESNGRGDEDELDEDLDNDIQVKIY